VVSVRQKLCKIADVNYKHQLKVLTTGKPAIDKMAMLDITWYEAQLARMAKGKKPKANLSEWGVFFGTLFNAGIYAFRKRRA
jgi:hypothetical protein